MSEYTEKYGVNDWSLKEAYDIGFTHRLKRMAYNSPYKESGHERDTTFEDERCYQYYSGFCDDEYNPPEK